MSCVHEAVPCIMKGTSSSSELLLAACRIVQSAGVTWFHAPWSTNTVSTGLDALDLGMHPLLNATEEGRLSLHPTTMETVHGWNHSVVPS